MMRKRFGDVLICMLLLGLTASGCAAQDAAAPKQPLKPTENGTPRDEPEVNPFDLEPIDAITESDKTLLAERLASVPGDELTAVLRNTEQTQPALVVFGHYRIESDGQSFFVNCPVNLVIADRACTQATFNGIENDSVCRTSPQSPDVGMPENADEVLNPKFATRDDVVVLEAAGNRAGQGFSVQLGDRRGQPPRIPPCRETANFAGRTLYACLVQNFSNTDLPAETGRAYKFLVSANAYRLNDDGSYTRLNRRCPTVDPHFVIRR
jgi:hypothetical protein